MERGVTDNIWVYFGGEWGSRGGGGGGRQTIFGCIQVKGWSSREWG